MREDSKEFYLGKFLSWDQMKVYGPAARHTRRIVHKFIRKLEFSSVIDISCGGGHLLQELSEKYEQTSLTGTELTDFALSINKERLPLANFFNFDLEKDEHSEKYDLVLCIDVLEHIEDDRLALTKLRRMTNKYMLLAVPLGRVTPEQRESLGHLHGYTAIEVNEKLTSAGFKPIKSLQWGFPFYNIIRCLTENFPISPAEGRISRSKKALFFLLYILYFFSLRFWGGRFFILCE